MAGDNATVEFSFDVGQLHPVIDPGDQGRVIDVFGVHHLTARPHDGDDVGQVKLMLGVIG